MYRILPIAFAATLVAFSVMPSALFAQESTTTKLANAQPGDVRLFVSGALGAPIMAVKAGLEKATGHTIVMEIGESRLLQSKIMAGQPFETAIITRPVIEEMISKGRIISGSDVDIGVVRVGIAVRGEAPKLDLESPNGLRKAILGAHGIRRFYGVGASVPTVDNLFAKLGLADAVKDRVVPLGVGKSTPEAQLPPGQYELIINLASEVIPMRGWTYLGLLPEQYQLPVYLAAGIGAHGNIAAAKAVITFLRSAAFGQVLKSDGMAQP